MQVFKLNLSSGSPLTQKFKQDTCKVDSPEAAAGSREGTEEFWLSPCPRAFCSLVIRNEKKTPQKILEGKRNEWQGLLATESFWKRAFFCGQIGDHGLAHISSPAVFETFSFDDYILSFTKTSSSEKPTLDTLSRYPLHRFLSCFLSSGKHSLRFLLSSWFLGTSNTISTTTTTTPRNRTLRVRARLFFRPTRPSRRTKSSAKRFLGRLGSTCASHP